MNDFWKTKFLRRILIFELFSYLVYILFLLILELISAELYCYSCTSAQSGCGDPIDVRLIHWKKCSGRALIENYCVKLIEKVQGISKKNVCSLVCSSLIYIYMHIFVN